MTCCLLLNFVFWLARSVADPKFTGASDPWFYLHTQKLVNAPSDLMIESILLTDYLFRYDRGGFWMGAHAFKYFITPFNRIIRQLLDYFMRTRVMCHAFHKSGHSKRSITQDVVRIFRSILLIFEPLSRSQDLF